MLLLFKLLLLASSAFDGNPPAVPAAAAPSVAVHAAAQPLALRIAALPSSPYLGNEAPEAASAS